VKDEESRREINGQEIHRYEWNRVSYRSIEGWHPRYTDKPKRLNPETAKNETSV